MQGSWDLSFREDKFHGTCHVVPRQLTRYPSIQGGEISAGSLAVAGKATRTRRWAQCRTVLPLPPPSHSHFVIHNRATFLPAGRRGSRARVHGGANNPRSAASRRRPTTKPKQNGRPLCLPGRPPLFLSHQAAVPLDSSVGVGECEITSQRAGRRRRSVKQRSSSGRGPRAPPARAWAA
jgi:hypothetical protein